jgi:DNA polymerase-3 subunit delta'
LAWLGEQSVPATEAVALLRAAGGRAHDALAFFNNGLKAKDWAGLPKLLLRGEAGWLVDATPAMVLSVLQKLCHDLVLRHSGAAPRFFDTNQLPPSNASVSVLTDWFKRLMQSARTAEHPFNAGLMLEALTADAQQTLMSKG